MAYSDYFDEYDWDARWDDEWGAEPSYRRYAAPKARRELTCRLCHKPGLVWGNVKGGRWALFENGKPHKEVCPAEKF